MNSRAHLWILNGRVPEACLDLDRWARWFETADCRVARDELMGGDIVVSTFFRPIGDPRGGDDPRRFETAVYGEAHFGKWLDRDVDDLRDQLETRRYSTWDEAMAGHREIAERFRVLAQAATTRAKSLTLKSQRV